MHMFRNIAVLVAAAAAVTSAAIDVSILKAGKTWKYFYSHHVNLTGSISESSGTKTFTIDSAFILKDGASVYFTEKTILIRDDTTNYAEATSGHFAYNEDSSFSSNPPPPFLWGATFQGEISTVNFHGTEGAKSVRMVDQTPYRVCVSTYGKYVEGIGQLEFKVESAGCQNTVQTSRYVLMYVDGNPFPDRYVVSAFARKMQDRKSGTGKKPLPGRVRLNDHEFSVLGKSLD